MRRFLIGTAILFIQASCAFAGEDAQTDPELAIGHQVDRIYWSDGDSGRIDGVPFRLADIDAPETGGVGAAIGGAGCEAERERGFEAKAFMVEETRTGKLIVSDIVDVDRYDRLVVRLSDDGRDLAELGKDAGVIESWIWKNGRPVETRPTWCP